MARIGHALALSLLVASGCDVVFGLEREPPPELADYDRCGAFLYNEPLRYAVVTHDTAAAWSWDDARLACHYRGMDLAVLNDTRELGMAPEEAVWPFWIGQRMIGSTSETVDGCPAVTTAVSARYVAADATACAMVGAPLEVDGASCDGALPPDMEPSFVTSALCETPRPESIDCLGQDPLDVSYILSDAPMTFAAAKQFCAAKDAHLVVVETQAEWRFLAKQTTEAWSKPFWLGSQFTQSKWETVNGCAGTYSWTGGTPGVPANGSCVAAQLRASTDEDAPASMVLDGVAPTPCTEDLIYALCER